ncbi:pre-mRNA-splicing factor CWC22 [Carex littledalei]|uniref:Pre-mRNA-splicing factor CWC22 n=1 Tax=Carex littledalei TaxID=544730 RepID=A0A833RSZ4_9POAL|nr:pre-mRNA-splicing factor CWC22 [Carex littledalei]
MALSDRDTHTRHRRDREKDRRRRDSGSESDVEPEGKSRHTKEREKERTPRDLDSASASDSEPNGKSRHRRDKEKEKRRDPNLASGSDPEANGKSRHRRDKEKERRRDRDSGSGSESDLDTKRNYHHGRDKRRESNGKDRDIEKEAESETDSDRKSRKRRDRDSKRNEREKEREPERDRVRKRDRDRERERERDRETERRRRHRDRENSPRRRDYERDSDRNKRKEREQQAEEILPPPPPPPPIPEAIPAALTGRTGGIYIPPHRMAQMMRDVDDKSSEPYQRLSWDALRKSINGLVNKVNATNIKNIIPELFAENLIRGRGLFCRSCMKSQLASPGFTDVFAALVAVVNTKFPEVGKLLLTRIVLQLKRAYKRNDKPQLLAATKFIAHMVNQLVAHEIIALELLTVLLENPTDDSVEVAVGFVKECGALLQDITPLGLHGVFERFRGILHEGEIDKRVQFLIEGLFAIRKAKFQGFPAIRPDLDLVEQEDQITHEISLDDEDLDPETNLDVFKANPNYPEDEKAYENLKRSILGDESSEDEAGSDEDGDEDDDDDEETDEDDEEEERMKIKDETETNLVNLRRTIYLTIMSSVDFEEAGHKLLKIKLEPGQEMELCIMMLECCSQERTYLRYYGLLGQRFCMINKVHQENFEKCFVQQYSMIHRLETNKLRNVAKFFAHLLGTDALPWHVLAYIRLTEEDTTSSSRIFIKILFQELSEHLGIRLLNERLNDPTMQESFDSIFPKDNPKNTRFAINFFTSIGLGGITESLREYLKNMPRLIMQQKPASESEDESGSSSDDSSGSNSSSGSESESESESDSESERKSKKRRKKN